MLVMEMASTKAKMAGIHGKIWDLKSEHLSKIIIHPTNSNIMWVASQGPLWTSGGERIYKSTDGGIMETHPRR